ncbi:MAG: GSCFA domain-containing protein [gamma proteobacterium symbiont of Taylorina sp.]|nr:GSCFA domain-containing protein [gamma proteobacterium symbiont of Taylorina sp.]
MNELSQEKSSFASLIDDDRIYNISPLRIKLNNNPVIDSFNNKISCAGSCFASSLVNVMNNLGITANYELNTGFHYTSKTFYELLKKWDNSGFNYTRDDIYLFESQNKAMSLYHNRLVVTGANCEERLFELMNEKDKRFVQNLKGTDVFILTLGNATYMEMTKTKHVICQAGGISEIDYSVVHSSVTEITNELKGIYSLLKKLINQSFVFIITVSPQRYAWSCKVDFSQQTSSEINKAIFSNSEDSLLQSNLDKAKLRVAIDNFLLEIDDEQVEYFPSFDIVMDELREYETLSNRVNDNLHVNLTHTANYVINRFLHSHVSSDMIDTLMYSNRLSDMVLRILQNNDDAYCKHYMDEVIEKLNDYYQKVQCYKTINSLANALLVGKYYSYAARLFSIIHGQQENTDPLNQLCKLINTKLDTLKGKKIIIYGAGKHTDFLFKHSKLLTLSIQSIVDKNYTNFHSIFGYKVNSPDILSTVEHDVVITSSIEFQDEMIQDIKQYTVSDIVTFYSTSDIQMAKQAILLI